MIKLSQACLGPEEYEAVSRVFSENYLGMGKEVKLFEEELQSFIGNDVEVACVNTGTAALHLAVQACDIGPGDEVIIPTITYVASFQAVSATGATPVACDVDLSTGFMDVSDAEKRITPRTKALMPVHYAGSFGNLEGAYALAQKYSLRVIEDAAHSFGGYYQGQRVGAKGDIICFSFDGIKNITCGEGGAVVTRDKEVLAKVKDLRLLGVERDTDQRYQGQRSWDFDIKEQGWRYHMSNINAAIGRSQLKKIDQFAEKRRSLAALYTSQLQTLPSVDLLNLDLINSVPHIFPIKLNNINRQRLQTSLLEEGIETGLHYKPNHLLTKYRSSKLEHAEVLWQQLVSLPLQCKLNENAVLEVCAKLRNFVTRC